jgi:BirA family biotin operon repressor/biotin-[acetyl-CoA-carboxylase] ligase
MSALTPAAVRPRTRRIGRRVVCLDSCASTNDEAWKLALDGAEDGTAVFAEEQTSGRGRFGRVWVAPRGASLLGSIILRPDIGVDRVPAVTAMAALAAADAIEECSGIAPKIVFPNDLYVEGRKIAGILVESRFISSKPDLFVIGVGVNVNVEAAQFPRELRETATSIRIEKGAEVDRARVARSLLVALEAWSEELEGNLRNLRKAWSERSFILGRRVKIREKGKAFAGTVTQVDPIDGLELRLDSGHARAVRGEHVEKLDLV